MAHRKEGSLAERAAEELLEMITTKKLYLAGEKLPNENILSEQLNISRSTLREAVKVLVAQDVLEIQRGRGTYVLSNESIAQMNMKKSKNMFASSRIGLKDMMEVRLVVEPNAAYFAAKRASEREIASIFKFGMENEEKIKSGEDRTKQEQAFHQAIAKATHNEFLKRLMPVVNEGIFEAVAKAKAMEKIDTATIEDHRMIMEYIQQRDGEGARLAMRLHIVHAMQGFGLTTDD